MNTISRIKMKVFCTCIPFACLPVATNSDRHKRKLRSPGKSPINKVRPVRWRVMIAVENTVSGTYTDDSGLYSLQVSPGKHTFVVSSLGYQTIKTSLDLHHDKTLDFKSGRKFRKHKSSGGVWENTITTTGKSKAHFRLMLLTLSLSLIHLIA